MRDMQVIVVPTSRLADRVALVRSVAVGVLLLLAGAAVAWLALGTSLIPGLIPDGRPGALETAVTIAAWGLALVLPAAFLVMGIARLASVAEVVAASRPRRVTPHLARALGPDHLAATDLRLPGGRRVHELVLGPFGVVVLGDVPPPSATRHVGGRWEVRDGRGRWLPIESPVQRAARDAERVRGWLASDERDFLVRVYAAVVTDDPGVERSAACAVVPPGELAAWLEALPVQRGLTPERRERLAGLVRDLATASAR
jgi:hypothetical protein